MFSQKSEYDRGVNCFSPEGRIHQIEYAIHAMKHGYSAVGIRVPEGVVLAVERRFTSSLMIPKSLEKIAEIDRHIAVVGSGMVTDAKTLIDFARVEAQNHHFTYNEPIPVRALTQAISDTALNFGEDQERSKQKPMSRPFGVALLIAGVDERGPALYMSDPSGTMVRYEAMGIGSADEGIQSILNEKYKRDMTLKEAETLAIDCLKQVMEEKINKTNVELCVITTTERKFTERNEEYIDGILKTLPQ